MIEGAKRFSVYGKDQQQAPSLTALKTAQCMHLVFSLSSFLKSRVARCQNQAAKDRSRLIGHISALSEQFQFFGRFCAKVITRN